MIAQIKDVLLGSGYKKKDYLDILVMMYEVFNVARRKRLGERWAVGLKVLCLHRGTDAYRRVILEEQ